MATKDTETQTIEPSDVSNVPEVLTFGDIEKALTDPFLDIDIDPLEAQKQIILRILQAEDEADVFGGRTTVGAREMVDTPFTLLGARLQKGDFADSALNIYAVMECVDAEGQPFVMTCGAAQIVAQVWWAHTRNKLPLTLVVREKDKPTEKGYKPMWLEFPGKGEQSF